MWRLNARERTVPARSGLCITGNLLWTVHTRPAKAPIRLVAITQMRTHLDRGVEHLVALQALSRTAPGFSYLLRKGIADRCPPLHVPSSTQLGLQINWQFPESKTRHKVLEHFARFLNSKIELMLRLATVTSTMLLAK